MPFDIKVDQVPQVPNALVSFNALQPIFVKMKNRVRVISATSKQTLADPKNGVEPRSRYRWNVIHEIVPSGKSKNCMFDSGCEAWCLSRRAKMKSRGVFRSLFFCSSKRCGCTTLQLQRSLVQSHHAYPYSVYQ